MSYFLVCTDVIFVVAPKHENDITALIKYVATPKRGYAQDASSRSYHSEVYPPTKCHVSISTIKSMIGWYPAPSEECNNKHHTADCIN